MFINMKKQKITLTFTIIIIIVSISISCSKSSTSTQANTIYTCDTNLSFANTIKPILDHNCNFSGCHDDQVITALNNFQTVHDGAAQI